MASYRKKHVKSKIHKIKPRKSIFRRLWFWIIVLFLIIVLFVFYFLLFYPGVQVKSIIISGNQKVASEDIENLISSSINNKILDFGFLKVNSRSIFLTNSDELNREILKKFPTIGSVKINKKFMQTLEFQVNEKIPVAIFCPPLSKITGAGVSLKDVYPEKGTCYFMDNNGIIFEPLYVMPQNMVVVRQTIDDPQIFVGEKVVQQNIMDLLSKAGKNLKDNFQINLKEALITNHLRLNVNTNENWQIYFDLGPGSDVTSQITKLNLLLNGGISTSQRKNLRYIDLRPKDRAIVCDNKTCGG